MQPSTDHQSPLRRFEARMASFVTTVYALLPTISISIIIVPSLWGKRKKRPETNKTPSSPPRQKPAGAQPVSLAHGQGRQHKLPAAPICRGHAGRRQPAQGRQAAGGRGRERVARRQHGRLLQPNQPSLRRHNRVLLAAVVSRDEGNRRVSERASGGKAGPNPGGREGNRREGKQNRTDQ